MDEAVGGEVVPDNGWAFSSGLAPPAGCLEGCVEVVEACRNARLEGWRGGGKGFSVLKRVQGKFVFPHLVSGLYIGSRLSRRASASFAQAI